MDAIITPIVLSSSIMLGVYTESDTGNFYRLSKPQRILKEMKTYELPSNRSIKFNNKILLEEYYEKK